VKPEVEPERESEKRTIKTVELFECEKCGKKLTARTLKYAHASKCPNGDGRPSASSDIPKPATQKTEKKQPERARARVQAYSNSLRGEDAKDKGEARQN
jgi:hypothetical protein